jgi:hypothetical protein
MLRRTGIAKAARMFLLETMRRFFRKHRALDYRSLTRGWITRDFLVIT